MRLRLAMRLPTAESVTAAAVSVAPSLAPPPLAGRTISGQKINATPARPSTPPVTNRRPKGAPNRIAAPTPERSGAAE